MKPILVSVVLAIAVFTGCTNTRITEDNGVALDYTMVDREQTPSELMSIITERKTEEFSITYSLEGYLYIAVGYGAKSTGGYSIAVKELCETDNSIVIDTELIGPKSGEPVNKMESYPYAIVKLEYRDKTVIFK